MTGFKKSEATHPERNISPRERAEIEDGKDSSKSRQERRPQDGGHDAGHGRPEGPRSPQAARTPDITGLDSETHGVAKSVGVLEYRGIGSFRETAERDPLETRVG